MKERGMFDRLYDLYSDQELRTMRTNALAQGYKPDSTTVTELSAELEMRARVPRHLKSARSVMVLNRQLKLYATWRVEAGLEQPYSPPSNHAQPPRPYDWDQDA